MKSSAASPLAKPDFADQFDRALKFRDEKRYGEAIRVLRQLGDDNPKSAKVFAILGDVYWRKRRLDDAIGCFRRACQLAPKSELASLGLFHTLWESGKREPAKEEMARFLSVSRSEEYDVIAKELGRHANGVPVTAKPVKRGRSKDK